MEGAEPPWSAISTSRVVVPAESGAGADWATGDASAPLMAWGAGNDEAADAAGTSGAEVGEPSPAKDASLARTVVDSIPTLMGLGAAPGSPLGGPASTGDDAELGL